MLVLEEEPWTPTNLANLLLLLVSINRPTKRVKGNVAAFRRENPPKSAETG
jgi:hypothetical protein